MNIIRVNGTILGVAEKNVEVFTFADKVRFVRYSTAAHLAIGEDIMEEGYPGVVSLCGHRISTHWEIDEVTNGKFCRLCIAELEKRIV